MSAGDFETWGIELNEREQAIADREAQRRGDEWDDFVPWEYREASLPDLAPEVESAVRAWMATVVDVATNPVMRGPNLVFAGPVGSGKTHAAFALAHELMFVGLPSVHGYAHRGGVRYWPMGDLLEDLRRDDEAHKHTRAYLRNSSFVLLDDVGAVRQTDWVLDQLYALFDQRHREVRPLIATTNLMPEDLEQYLGQHAYSRLVHGAHTVELHGQNRRRA